MITGVPGLLRKITKYRPRIVCFVGKGIWQVFLKVVIGNPSRDTHLEMPSSSLKTSRFFSGTPESRPSTPVGSQPTRSPYFSIPSKTPSTSREPSPPRRVVVGDVDTLPQLVSGLESSQRAERTNARKARYVFDWGLQPVKIVHATDGGEFPVETLAILPTERHS